ncbi:MAG: ABC transporter substrate-binding protein [Deinococcales bacterium]
MLIITSLGLASAQTRGGTLVIGTIGTPNTLNPAIQSGTVTGVPGTQLFATPLRFDENWQPHPYLAESWDVAEDGLSVTLHLVKNAIFHDGEPITSEDVVCSVNTVKENHPFKTMFGPVVEVETPDEHTAVIRLEHPHRAILLAMSSALLPIIPSHIYCDGTPIRENPANNAPIGSGPFKFVEFTPGESITLERFDGYFIENEPYLDKIIIKTYRDTNALILSMQRGEVDMIPFMANPRDIDRLAKERNIEVTNKGYEGIGPIQWLAFNTQHEYLSDKRVRQAIAYAVDRDFIVNALQAGFSQPAYGPIVPSSPYFNDAIPHYDVDLEKANALLDEAGYPKGADGTRFTISVDFLPGPDGQLLADYLKSQLPEIGIEVEIRASADFPTWANRISNYDFALTTDVVFNWGDPVIGVHRTFLSNNIKPGVIWSNTQQYSNERVDEILAQAAVANSDEERKALYDEFQMIVADELPIYWINLLPYHTAYNVRVQNVPVNIWGTMSPMDEIYIEGN